METLNILLNRYLFPSKDGKSASNLNTALSLIKNNQLLFQLSESDKDSVLISRFLDRVTLLSSSHDRITGNAASFILSECISQLGYSCIPWLEKWAGNLCQSLAKSRLSRVWFESSCNALTDIFLICKTRPELIRDLVSVSLPVAAHTLLESIESSENVEIRAISMKFFEKWLKINHSVMKLATEKLKPILWSRYVWDVNGELFHSAASLLVASNMHSNVNEQHLNFTRSVIATTFQCLELIFESSTVGRRKIPAYKPFQLPDLPSDYLERVPFLVSLFQKMAFILEECFNRDFAMKISVPICDILDLVGFVFASHERREDSMLECFDLVISHLNSLRICCLRIIQMLYLSIGNPMKRYRTQIISLCSDIIYHTKFNRSLRKAFYQLVLSIGPSLFDSYFVKMLGNETFDMIRYDLAKAFKSKSDCILPADGKKRKFETTNDLPIMDSRSTMFAIQMIQLYICHADFLTVELQNEIVATLIRFVTAIHGHQKLKNLPKIMLENILNLKFGNKYISVISEVLHGRSNLCRTIDCLIHPRLALLNRSPLKPMQPAINEEDSNENIKNADEIQTRINTIEDPDIKAVEDMTPTFAETSLPELKPFIEIASICKPFDTSSSTSYEKRHMPIEIRPAQMELTKSETFDLDDDIEIVDADPDC